MGEFTRIVTFIMLYNLYENINFHSFYISNTRDSLLKYTKYYSQNFLKKLLFKKIVVHFIGNVITILFIIFRIFKIKTANIQWIIIG